MNPTEPRNPPPPGDAEPPRSEAEVLEEMRTRVAQAQAAAERIANEAVAAAAGAISDRAATRPPPSGYAVPGERPGDGDTSDLQSLVALIEGLRGLIPPELARQLAELARELLLLVRALIDWYLERVERRDTEPVEVEDIPIS